MSGGCDRRDRALFWSPAGLVGLVGTMISPIGGWGFWPFPKSCVSLSIVIMIMT